MIRKLGEGSLKTKNDYHRPQDTWLEQPSQFDDAESGGPRRRVRSLRSRRTMFTLAVTAFTVGALIIIGTSPYKNDFLAPGPLCSSHAQILAGQGADRCAACHGASNRTLASWMTDTLTGGRAIPVSQSDLCMKCHGNSISPDFSLNPHSIATNDLQKRTLKSKQAPQISWRPVVQSITSPPLGPHSEIACSACHREHHGSASLTTVTDQQCQSCHAQVFESFETNHPEFTNWPQQRRSRIAFDHSTHAGKHFPGKEVEFNCNQCHVDGPYRNVKKLAPFERSCAACHDQHIQQSEESGFVIFALPSIDPEAIEAQGLKIGSWPLAATGDFDGRIPPAMRLLLQADPVAREVLDRLREKFGNDIDFADLNAEDPADVANAVEFVWAIKRLLNELAVGGQSALGQRLSQAMDVDVSLDQVMSLASELDESVFKNTARRWLPDLQHELAEHQASRVGQVTPRSTTRRNFDSALRARIQRIKFSKIVLSDDEVLAANPLADLLPAIEAANENELTSDEPIGSSHSSDASTAADSVLNERRQQRERMGPSSVEPRKQKVLTVDPSSVDDIPSDSDWLAINPLAAKTGTGAVALRFSPDASSVEPASSANSANTATDRAESENQPNATAWEPPEVWELPKVIRAGWYRDDERFRVFYRPGGHEDRRVKAWSDLVASVQESKTRPELQPLFSQLLSDKGIGLCATCHTVDQLADDSFAVNWVAAYRDPAIGAFTKFSHQPHTLQPHLRDCSACHDTSRPVSNKDSFKSHDPSEVVSNFAPITKLNCVNCHREGSTNSGCTHCHSYHVGAVVETNRN